jgi:HEAT repeat protein
MPPLTTYVKKPKRICAVLYKGKFCDMADNIGNLPLDTRLLSDAIMELSIARRNVSIYPKDHPIVEQSLRRAYNFFHKLFELRNEITLAVAKDTIIIDSCFLEKSNPVYKEFAQCLSKINIVSVTLIRGLTAEELYSFLHFILKSMQEESPEKVRDLFEECKFLHIRVKYVDYSAFKLVEGQTGRGGDTIPLWEEYISGLLENRLQTGESGDVIQEIPPLKLAGFLNNTTLDKFRGESYDRVITNYMRRSSDKMFSGGDLKKLTDFINGLRPELKKQFLSAAVNNFSKDIVSLEESLGDIAADDIIDLLGQINEQVVVIPEALKNILDKFSNMNQEGFKSSYLGAGLIGDDILLSREITGLLSEANFKEFVSEEYKKEIQKILSFDARKRDNEYIREHEKEWSEENIGRVFHQTIMEIMSSDNPDIIPPEDYDIFIAIIRDYSIHHTDTGRYREVLETIQHMESNMKRNYLHDIAFTVLQYVTSPQFLSVLVDSFRIMGREMREDALMLCEYYGEPIVQPLIDALIDEESLTIRRFLLGMVTHLGDAAIPEVEKYLNDERWYVKRNMLFILQKYGSRDALQKARPYCAHEDSRVALEAIKCLLMAEDEQGIIALRGYLKSDSKDLVKKALSLSGAHRVKGVVPDLIQMLQKMTLTGLDYEERIPIVRALGRIGGSRAKEALRAVLSAKTFLFRGPLEKLKKETRSILENSAFEKKREQKGKNGNQ